MSRWGITYRGSGIVPGRGDYGPPDEPDWMECENCSGAGKVEGDECPVCEGCKWLDEEGQPVKGEA